MNNGRPKSLKDRTTVSLTTEREAWSLFLKTAHNQGMSGSELITEWIKVYSQNHTNPGFLTGKNEEGEQTASQITMDSYVINIDLANPDRAELTKVLHTLDLPHAAKAKGLFAFGEQVAQVVINNRKQGK